MTTAILAKFEIRATKWAEGNYPAGTPIPCERITGSYDSPSAAEALAAFAQDRPEAVASAVAGTSSASPQPARRSRNAGSS